MKGTPFIAVMLFAALNAWAGIDEDVARIRQEWERIKYQTPAKEQAAAFEKLSKESEKVAVQYPNQAEPAIWHGIIAVSYTHLRAHETPEHLVCRLLLEKKK